MVVIPKYHGLMGNRLSQYIFPRIIASSLGYEFNAPPLLKLEEHISGNRYDTPIQYVTDLSPTGAPVDMGSILSNKKERKIVFEGYFHQADKYIPHRNYIMELLNQSLVPIAQPSDTIAIHVRLGDYISLGWNIPPLYYEIALEQAIKTSNPTNCIVYSGGGCGDTSEGEFRKYVDLFSRYLRVQISKGSSEINDFQSIMGSRSIICCNSSFSWWAAFLSMAENVWMPHNYGPWGIAQKGDSVLRPGQVHTPDLRCNLPGWHIVDMNIEG